MALKLARPARGRPQKFGRPSRAVTVTLPEDIIAALTGLDSDVGRAVVRLAQPLVADVVPHPPAELSKYGNSAVIVVKPLVALERIPGVTLVPMPDGRALISLEDSMTVYEFELKLRDAIDENPNLAERERSVLASINEILKSARRTRSISIHQRRIIVLRSARQRARA